MGTAARYTVGTNRLPGQEGRHAATVRRVWTAELAGQCLEDAGRLPFNQS
jgi:hypothetical protein